MSTVPHPQLDPVTPAPFTGGCPLRRRWFCPLRALVFGHLIAALLTGVHTLVPQVGRRLTGDVLFEDRHPGLRPPLEGVSGFAFLSVFVFPPLIIFLARRFAADRREFFYLMLATVTLGFVQVLAALPLVQ